MILQEIVKSFIKPREEEDDSSYISPENVLMDMTDDQMGTGSFFDENNTGIYNSRTALGSSQTQRSKIISYRDLAQLPEVAEAVDEIVNEVVFVMGDASPLKLNVNEENDKLVQALDDSFDKIMKMMNIKTSLFEMVKRSYIDGQLVFHCAYDEKNTKGGIKSIKMMEPCGLWFDYKEHTWSYFDAVQTNGYRTQTNTDQNKVTYSHEEIVKDDFGLFGTFDADAGTGLNKVKLGYLEYAKKPANMLKTLEDLLVPLRFSRSISRRVFNVDIGDLPNKRGMEVMQDYQTKFKYKKFYDAESGEVTNSQHITSMVEDYWFANRSGGKGTTVDVLDESGNLGELGDIIYMQKKLYKSMKVPTSRVVTREQDGGDFDMDATAVSREDLKFYMFISRLRSIYSSIFKKMLRMEAISTGIMTQEEWNEREDDIEIIFTNDNTFIEKMQLNNFMTKIDIYATAQEYAGKLFSVDKILKEVFGLSSEEIEEEFKKIDKESQNDLFSKFYNDDDDY